MRRFEIKRFYVVGSVEVYEESFRAKTSGVAVSARPEDYKKENEYNHCDASNTTTWYVKEVQASKGYKRKDRATTIVIDETEEKVQESDH